MSVFTGILTAIGGLATIVGGIVYLVKLWNSKFGKTQEQVDAQVDSDVAAQKQKAEMTGRPQ